MAAQYKIVIEQGSTYDQTFLFKNTATNMPIDLTNYNSRMQLRTAYTAAAASAALDEGSGMTTGGTAGTIRVQMTAEQTAAIAAGSYVYDIEIYFGANVQRKLEGKAIVTPEATK